MAREGMAEAGRGAEEEEREPPGGGVAASEAWRKGEEEAAETEGGKEEGMSVWWSIEWLPKSVGFSTKANTPFSHSPPSGSPNFTPASPHPLGALTFSPSLLVLPTAISYGFPRRYFISATSLYLV